MRQTAKYCEDCEKKLSPADTTPRVREFIRASLFTDVTLPRGSGPLTEKGSCEKCGKSGVVIYYETLS
jgi:hypothetical protein